MRLSLHGSALAVLLTAVLGGSVPAPADSSVQVGVDPRIELLAAVQLVSGY